MKSLYELVKWEDLRPGDRIYFMAQRRIVLSSPWHPEDMKPEWLRISMTDSEITALSPPSERDFLVPRVVPEILGPDDLVRLAGGEEWQN